MILVTEPTKSYSQFLWITLWINLGFIAQIRKKHAPCLDCAKLIYQSGIETLYYRNAYRDEAGVKFLKLGGVNVHHYNTGKVPL